MKEAGTAHWNNPNTGATNSSGFSALPGGFRYGHDGNFGTIWSYGLWWSSTTDSTATAWSRILSYDLSTVSRLNYSQRAGFSCFSL